MRRVFTDGRAGYCHLLKRRPQPRDILRWRPSRIEAAVKGRAGRPARYGSTGTAAGVLASLNMVADSLELLPEWEHTRPTFCNGRVVRDRKRWVFLTSTPAYRAKILPLPFCVVDLFILRMMGYCEGPHSEAGMVWCWTSWRALTNCRSSTPPSRKIASMGTLLCWAFRAVANLKNATARTPRHAFAARDKLFFKTTEPRAASGFPMPSGN